MEQKIIDEITYVELPRNSNTIKFMWKLYSSFLLKDNKTKINSYYYIVGRITSFSLENLKQRDVLKAINLEHKCKKHVLIKFMEEFEKTKEYKIEKSKTWYFINGEWKREIVYFDYEKEREEYEKHIEKAVAKKTIKTEEVYYLSDNNPIRKYNQNYPSLL